MKFLDLFSGIGGFRLGMEQAGHTCVGYCEIDKFSRKSYEAIFDIKGEWTAHDITTVRITELPTADIWCFGFPCQDISLAGKLRGFTTGHRSSLFFTVTNLIKQLPDNRRPTILFIENVKNLLSINGGLDFLRVQIELYQLGYDVEWSVLDSAALVPQHRERLFIVGHLRTKRQRQVFPIPDNGTTTTKGLAQVNPTVTHQYERVYDPDGIAPTLVATSGIRTKIITPTQKSLKVSDATHRGYTNAHSGDGISLTYPTSQTRRGRVAHKKAHTLLTDGSEAVVDQALRIRRLTPLEYWRLQGFPDEVFYKAKDSGLSDAQLYKQAGNSVTVPIIKAIVSRFQLLSDQHK
ncbi:MULTISPECIES: DNA cytosine methyltransferase [Lactobacillaceae]|jgi:DNA (cytosine-5)-methyltransferase 1|uniref:DNA (cytosine-5-)-methyltransferase n=2 Tax=Paucilactobacillus hokkaidonensis TaxID=1193095 RepID=A0A0A1GVR5_9LACO|nr:MULTISPECIES: DNA (cytosine-5-)-methyltransferase [Lactobacillaceae]KRO10035.1 methyl transferase [Paucilactobacillus hokkaidonensis]MCI2031693.1 DNA (cytosine-5-)-methyltransferase [Limosilactobacillus sp.]MDN7144837.1 DNA (cytosine-5-)-methyltransferase [Liquorilactobacillus mali]BAP86352.1 DNA (cytosine-5-)-methyltransferase family protein [Paucilactobacillus hokkaidonensis JCM 18461]